MVLTLLAVALGSLVGLSLGALGGGGSTLAVPILVFIGGMSVQDATTASLLVVGIAALIGAVRHWRLGNVRLGVGLGFGAAGIVGSRIGTTINQSLDEQVLLLVFSALIVFVAQRMYRSAASAPAAQRLDTCTTPVAVSPVTPTRPREQAVAATPAASVGTTTATGGIATVVATPARHRSLDGASLVRIAVAASGVGLLTGLFGVGGGFAVVPALTLLLGFEAKEAIGTSLVVIAVNAAIALAMRSGDLSFDWGIVAPFLATVAAGVLVGTHIASRLDARRLTRAFAVMLALVAAWTATSALVT
jgi:uncharacterized membrane protein YfcA